DEVDHLELQRGSPAAEQVTTLEARLRRRLDYFLDGARHRRQRRHRGLGVHVQAEQRAPLVLAPEVAYARLEDVRVRQDDLLAADAAQPRTLDADVLHGARDVIDAERIAEGEGLVQGDRHRSQQ